LWDVRREGLKIVTTCIKDLEDVIKQAKLKGLKDTDKFKIHNRPNEYYEVLVDNNILNVKNKVENITETVIIY
jgi:hypothetical protein